MDFFVVIDVELHVVDLLLFKPVHAVLQESNSRIQISVFNLLWCYNIVYSLII